MPQDWQECIDHAFRDRNLSRKTLQDMRGTISGFWKYLKHSRIPFDAPEDPLVIPRQAKIGTRTIVQPQDLQKVFSINGHEVRGRFYQPHYLFAWRFALATGLRPGEKLYEELLISDKNLHRTENAKIFVEQRPEVGRNSMKEKLDRLRAAAESNDAERMVALLHEICPTFRTPEEVNREAEAAMQGAGV